MSENKKLEKEQLEKVSGGGIGRFKQCPCGVLNMHMMTKCMECGRDLSKIPSTEWKVCPHCYKPNNINKSICLYCLQSLDH